MAKGKTLWEMLLAKLQGPVELRFYNPLKAKVGSPVTLDEVELRDYNFFVQEVREYRRTIGAKAFPFVDYVLLARPLNGDDIRARLRLLPAEESDRVSGLTHNALLLRLYDETAYSVELHNVVRDTTGKFQVLENGEVTEEYWRINGVTDSYKATVSIIRDANQDNEVGPDEVERQPIEYWDYWRDTRDEFGQPLLQYLFVEMDAKNGWFQIWRGQAVDPQKVIIL